MFVIRALLPYRYTNRQSKISSAVSRSASFNPTGGVRRAEHHF
jgi:hypothetical protein